MSEPVTLPDEAPVSVGFELHLREDGNVAVTIVGRPLDMPVVFSPAYADRIIRLALPPEDAE